MLFLICTLDVHDASLSRLIAELKPGAVWQDRRILVDLEAD
jgi:hypothetical protein